MEGLPIFKKFQIIMEFVKISFDYKFQQYIFELGKQNGIFNKIIL